MKPTAVSCPWPYLPLSQVASLQKGKKPGRLVEDGALPYLEASILRGAGSPLYIPREDIDQLVVAEQTDTLLLWDGANAGELFPGTTGVVCSTMAYIRSRHHTISPAFLRYYLLTQTNRLRTTTAGSTVPHVRKRVVETLAIPLPPLPVQERIVAILEKADEIRRKRQEALQIADQILPALFIEMFGDPATNPKGWPVVTLADTLDTCEAGTWGQEPQAGSEVYAVLRSTNMLLDGRLDFADVAQRAVSRRTAERCTLEDGDLLLNRSSGSREHIGKLCFFRRPQDTDCLFLFSNFVQRLRPNPLQATSEYLFFYLRTDFARYTLERLYATSSGLRNLNMTEYLRQTIMLPPVDIQQRFADYASAFESVRAKLQASLCDAESAFNVLLQRAFTGELTAEWEARNADWIAERQAFYERLPQLVLLAFLHEKAQQARKAGVLITALMKYAFLLQMEGSSRRRLYNFVPYHYGPFAQEVYSDLENLQQQGLVIIEEDDEKTRINLTAPDKAEQALLELPEDLRQDVAAIVETYGNLDHEGLLKIVYERYPAYAKKSRRRSAGKRR